MFEIGRNDMVVRTLENLENLESTWNAKIALENLENLEFSQFVPGILRLSTPKFIFYSFSLVQCIYNVSSPNQFSIDYSLVISYLIHGQ